MLRKSEQFVKGNGGTSEKRKNGTTKERKIGMMEDEKNFIAQLMELCYIYSGSETCSQVFVST